MDSLLYDALAVELFFFYTQMKNLTLLFLLLTSIAQAQTFDFNCSQSTWIFRNENFYRNLSLGDTFSIGHHQFINEGNTGDGRYSFRHTSVDNTESLFYDNHVYGTIDYDPAGFKSIYLTRSVYNPRYGVRDNSDNITSYINAFASSLLDGQTSPHGHDNLNDVAASIEPWLDSKIATSTFFDTNQGWYYADTTQPTVIHVDQSRLGVFPCSGVAATGGYIMDANPSHNSATTLIFNSLGIELSRTGTNLLFTNVDGQLRETDVFVPIESRVLSICNSRTDVVLSASGMGMIYNHTSPRTVHTLTAFPSNGWEFVRWTYTSEPGNPSSQSNPLVFTSVGVIRLPVMVEATFLEKPRPFPNATGRIDEVSVSNRIGKVLGIQTAPENWSHGIIKLGNLYGTISFLDHSTRIKIKVDRDADLSNYAVDTIHPLERFSRIRINSISFLGNSAVVQNTYGFNDGDQVIWFSAINNTAGHVQEVRANVRVSGNNAILTITSGNDVSTIDNYAFVAKIN